MGWEIFEFWIPQFEIQGGTNQLSYRLLTKIIEILKETNNKYTLKKKCTIYLKEEGEDDDENIKPNFIYYYTSYKLIVSNQPSQFHCTTSVFLGVG